MAFSQVILGEMNIGNGKIIFGTFNNAAVTTGTIDIRGTAAGAATKVPYRVIQGHINNATTNTAPAELLSEAGTLAFTTASGDTGTWYFLTQ